MDRRVGGNDEERRKTKMGKRKTKPEINKKVSWPTVKKEEEIKNIGNKSTQSTRKRKLNTEGHGEKEKGEERKGERDREGIDEKEAEEDEEITALHTQEITKPS